MTAAPEKPSERVAEEDRNLICFASIPAGAGAFWAVGTGATEGGREVTSTGLQLDSRLGVRLSDRCVHRCLYLHRSWYTLLITHIMLICRICTIFTFWM